MPWLNRIEALRSAELSLLDYLTTLEARFAEHEPEVLAFVPEEGRFVRLRREAEALLRRYPDPATRPPLFGATVGVKDIFHVAGFITRAGARLPAEELQGEEGPAVGRLKAAGALIVGKTATTEFAYFAPGPTRNPHRLTHTPGGSSSGSAAAVAAGLCDLALGTQTIGSISRPAAFCGVVGYKPSYERLSRAGVIPLSPSLDHVGLFAPDVAGAHLAATVLLEDWQPVSLTTAPVLGIPEGPYLNLAEPAGQTHFRQVCLVLMEAGFRVLSAPALPDSAEIAQRHQQLMAAECADVHADWFARYGPLYHPKTAELIRRGQTVTPDEAAAGRAGREKLRQELTDMLDRCGLDLWLAPAATGPAPHGLESTGNPAMNLPWTHSGLPTLSLPAGFVDGLPMGLQLIGRWGQDERLFAQAALIEAALMRAQAEIESGL